MCMLLESYHFQKGPHFILFPCLCSSRERFGVSHTLGKRSAAGLCPSPLIYFCLSAAWLIATSSISSEVKLSALYYAS